MDARYIDVILIEWLISFNDHVTGITHRGPFYWGTVHISILTQTRRGEVWKDGAEIPQGWLLPEFVTYVLEGS